MRQLVAEYERHLIETALAAAGGCQRRAAEALGLLPSTLHEKMRRLGVSTARGAAKDRAGQRM